MKKIFKIKYSIAVLMLLVLSACLKKDLGNYNPNGVNELTISKNLKDAYLANVDDVLKLDANTEQSLGNGDLSYQWSYYSVETNIKVVVGNAPLLELKIDMPTGDYVLVVESTDNKTGVKAFKKIALTVKRLTSEGWLLLTWMNNKANLSIVSTNNEVLRNFLIPSEQFPINYKPEKLFCSNHWDTKIQPIAIKTAQPKMFFLDRNTFEIHNDETSAFPASGSPKGTYFGADLYFGTYYMWDSEGMIYQSSGGEDANYPSGFDLPFIGNYKASNFILPVASGYPVPAVFYDEQAKRFMYQEYGGNELFPFQPKPDDAPFDMNNFTDEIKYTALGASDFTYVIGKNMAGDFNLYTMALSDGLNTYPAMAKVKLNIPNNGTPSHYTISGKLPLLYYIAGNKLYLYKMGEKLTLLLYTFPEGETAAALEMFRETIMQNESSQPLVNNRLMIATNKGTEGIVYAFDLSATGVLKTGKFTTRNDGFDTIVDMVYKERR